MNNNEGTLTYAGTFTSVLENAGRMVTYPLEDLGPGVNFLDKHIIKISSNKEVEWIVSRLCDHANGTLQPCNESEFAQCPLHGWKLDLRSLQYSNVNVKKDTLAFEVSAGVIKIQQQHSHIQLPKELFQEQQNQEIKVRFLAHACLLISCGNKKIITDPWLKGPCFLNGWWHHPGPPADAMEQLLDADLVYLSHNHPDHTHEETLVELQKHRPDIPIIIPNFKSKSAEWPIHKLGFTNIKPLAFNQIYRFTPDNLFLSIFKSGDFRDDSGLYLSYGKKQILITVDSSVLNQLVLPANIDLLATAFTGGASGFPWCFDHYTEEQKKEITEKRHLSIKQHILDYVSTCQPRAYLPYAGYFKESTPRDQYIQDNNKKITCSEVKNIIKENFADTAFIDPTLHDQIILADSIHVQNSDIQRSFDIDFAIIEHYINNESCPNQAKLLNEAKHYFINAGFSDELILFLLPCNDDFNPMDKGMIIDFSSPKTPGITIDTQEVVQLEYQRPPQTLRKLLIKVRSTALWKVIDQHKSWEELSIGFHCRVHRNPDVYNSDFWYHFSNAYIG